MLVLLYNCVILVSRNRRTNYNIICDCVRLKFGEKGKGSQTLYTLGHASRLGYQKGGSSVYKQPGIYGMIKKKLQLPEILPNGEVRTNLTRLRTDLHE